MKVQRGLNEVGGRFEVELGTLLQKEMKPPLERALELSSISAWLMKRN